MKAVRQNLHDGKLLAKSYYCKPVKYTAAVKNKLYPYSLSASNLRPTKYPAAPPAIKPMTIQRRDPWDPK
jgi:hypothetical protein